MLNCFYLEDILIHDFKRAVLTSGIKREEKIEENKVIFVLVLYSK